MVMAPLSAPDEHSASVAPPRLEMLKALGDNTRYAIYLELARSSRPLSTADVALTLGLHANTVRPHLERMRDLGLLELAVDARGSVGRPQHLYSVAPNAPALGLEPPTMPLLASMLVRLATDAQLSSSEAVDAGMAQGQVDAAEFTEDTPCVDAVMARSEVLGFDPEAAGGPDGVTVAFTHCPFRELADTAPAVVCGLHEGMVRGITEELGGAEIMAFHGVTDRSPCQVEVLETTA
jgi:predicted ArsR family transcriptional regulator